MSLFGISATELNGVYGKVKSTLGTSLKYVAPHASSVAAGAAIGGAYSMVSGDGHGVRDAALGAVGGLGMSNGSFRQAYHGAKGAEASVASRFSGGWSAMKGHNTAMWGAAEGASSPAWSWTPRTKSAL